MTALKTAGSVLAATAALLTTLKDNPQIAEGAQQALEKVRGALHTEGQKERFDAKIAAIEACADAVEEQFPGAAEVTQWREAAKALRLRGQLVWQGGHGRSRRKSMQSLSDDTTRLLERINARLAELVPGLAEVSAEPPRKPRFTLGRGRIAD